MTQQIPLQVTFRGMDRSEAVEERISEKVAKLARTGVKITDCKVVIEADPNPGKGFRFQVHAKAEVPGHGELVASNDSDPEHQHDDVYVAIRDAMDALHRQLEDLHDKRASHRN